MEIVSPERPGAQATENPCVDSSILSLGTTVADRFWSKVDKTNGPLHPTLGRCWTWTASKDAHGYGHFMVGKRPTRRLRQAHRVAYELTSGPLPDGQVARHRCDLTSCVRPSHLVSGTQAQNAADKVERGRSTFGSRNPKAVLDDAKVLDIRRRCAGGEGRAQLAAEYHVSISLIYQVVVGRLWRHLPLAGAAQ